MHIDMPTKLDIERLATARHTHAVTVYLPTSTQPNDAEANHLEARARFEEAVERLRAAHGAGSDAVDAVAAHLDELLDDPVFWAEPGRSLAVFATPGSIIEFRLPNALPPHVSVGDRFAIVPLLRAVTFPSAAYVLALSQGAARLIEVPADQAPEEVHVPGLPKDAESTIGLRSIGGRSAYGRLQGSEGRKVRLSQYARAVDHAIRPLLNGQSLPLVLAATEPLASIYGNLSGVTHLADEVIPGNPEELSDAELADAARGVLDRLAVAEVAGLAETFAERRSNGRATADLSDLARAAAFGAIATLAVDMDAEVPGDVGDDGVLVLGSDSGRDALEEIVRHALASGARVLALRRADLPEGVQAAGILRYSV